MVDPKRFELLTPAVQRRCSPVELRALYIRTILSRIGRLRLGARSAHTAVEVGGYAIVQLSSFYNYGFLTKLRHRINAETEGGDAPECTCNGRVETPLEHRPCRETAEPRRGYQTYGAASYS